MAVCSLKLTLEPRRRLESTMFPDRTTAILLGTLGLLKRSMLTSTLHSRLHRSLGSRGPSFTPDQAEINHYSWPPLLPRSSISALPRFSRSRAVYPICVLS